MVVWCEVRLRVRMRVLERTCLIIEVITRGSHGDVFGVCTHFCNGYLGLGNIAAPRTCLMRVVACKV